MEHSERRPGMQDITAPSMAIPVERTVTGTTAIDAAVGLVPMRLLPAR
jgi:hypothetical protein